MSHWHDDYDRFTRPRMSERHLWIVLAALLVLCVVLLVLVPGGAPEPGYGPHRGAGQVVSP